MKTKIYLILTIAVLSSCSGQTARWSEEKASEWSAKRGWIRGCDYIPSYAINQLEMWQEQTFDIEYIDRELGMAEDLGFNMMRVFLHHKLWEQDKEGFKSRIDKYLEVSSSHGISTMLVFLDDCWCESCELGVQPVPARGVHNSGWCKDPGILYFGPCGSGCEYAEDTTAILKVLESYIKDIMTTFKNDKRVGVWDMYNEPGGGQDPYRYGMRSFPLLKNTFRWAREVKPSQPITSGVWSPNPALSEMNVWQLENSDIVTYHTYEPLESHKAMVDTLKKYNRPMICTEYMARTQNSTFQTIMPMLKEEGIGAINWGFVSGKTNTIFAWATPLDVDEPEIWFHDILRKDGTPFSAEEIQCIKSLTTDKPRALTITPYPQSVSIQKGFFDAEGAKVVIDDSIVDQSRVAIDEFAALLKSSSTKIGKRCIKFKLEPGLGGEEYEIAVSKREVTVKASSYTGILYAIATLKQLLPEGIYTGTARSGAEWKIPCCRISDKPRFSYRGVELDCSRHFFPVNDVKKILDVMAIYKLNRFHWHLTDDHGWRIEIKKYPLLTEIGAWRDGTMREHDMNSNDGVRYGGYYTQEQISDVVDYAKKLGIEIVPEIDLPAHMVSALSAYPYLGCTGGPYKLMSVWDIAPDVLCAGKESSFDFLEDVFDEVCALFPYEYVHIGGDECPKGRWQNCPACQARIKKLGLKDTDKGTAEQYLQNYVTARVQAYLASKGKRVIGWDEILEGELQEGATVMSWRGVKGGITAVENGFDAIMTPCDYCYLDYCQSDKPELEPVGIGHYVPIEKCYSYEPCEGMKPEVASHILGLQGNVWTEFMSTISHVEYMLLPRIIALGEVMWCQKEVKNYPAFKEDLINHQFPLLKSKGYIYSNVVNNDY